jgi:hypothetical protein
MLLGTITDDGEIEIVQPRRYSFPPDSCSMTSNASCSALYDPIPTSLILIAFTPLSFFFFFQIGDVVFVPQQPPRRARLH